MNIIVQKFGGSSLADVERIRAVAKRIEQTYQRFKRIVVVVSAMMGETDRLINLIRALGGTTCEREYACALATGEQLSAALLALALKQLGLSSQSCNASQLKIATDPHYDNAKIIAIDGAYLENLLLQDVIPVVTGFQGINKENEITTLGRGGSDTTAVAIAATLQAIECQIYSDVAGVYTADPRIVPDATIIPQIGYTQMLELSANGAKILQKRAVILAGCYRVPLRVMSSYQQQGSTLINDREETVEKPVVAGISSEGQQIWANFLGIPIRPNLANYLLTPLSQKGIEFDLVQQSPPNAERQVDFSLVTKEEWHFELETIMRRLAKELFAAEVNFMTHLAKLSLVGAGFRSYPSTLCRMLGALDREGIEIFNLYTSESKLSVLIQSKYVELAVRTLHEEFQLAKQQQDGTEEETILDAMI